MKPAIFSCGRIETGVTHGHAFLLMPEEFKSNPISGYVDEIGNFFSDKIVNKSLIIMRHGESEYNAKITDNPDSRLTRFGRRQCIDSVNILKEMNLDGYIGFVSPLLRCLESAKIISRRVNVKFKVNKNLGEIGIKFPNEGLQIKNRKDQFKEFEWENENFCLSKETEKDFIKRIKQEFDVLPEKSIIVTHGHPLIALLELSLHGNMETIPHWNNAINNNIHNACVFSIEKGKVIYPNR